MSFSIRENEKIIKSVKQHFVFVLPVIVIWLFVFAAIFWIRVWKPAFDFWGYWWWVIGALFLIAVITIWYKVFLWKKNVLILTSQRIVQIQQKGLFSSTVMELLYRDVLEISYIRKGIRASIYGFGNIKMRTASNNEIVIENIPNPDGIVEIINKIR